MMNFEDDENELPGVPLRDLTREELLEQRNRLLEPLDVVFNTDQGVARIKKLLIAERVAIAMTDQSKSGDLFDALNAWYAATGEVLP